MKNSLRYGEPATRPETQLHCSIDTPPIRRPNIQSSQLKGITKRELEWIPTVFAEEHWEVDKSKKKKKKTCIAAVPPPPPSVL